MSRRTQLTTIGCAALGLALATSAWAAPALTVNGSSSPVSVNTGSVATIGVSDGPGNTTDWVGMYATTAADIAPLTWKFLNGTTTAPTMGTTSATLTFTIPATAGTYNFRFFSNNTYNKIATSPTATASVPPPAALSVNGSVTGIIVVPGSTLTVSLTNGPGNATNWLGLYSLYAADNTYLDWCYLDGTKTLPASGLTSATLTFTLPSTPGVYNVRLFSTSYNRVATSPTVTGGGQGAVVGGQATSYALGSDGKVWSWGSNGYSSLGDGTSADHREPVPVVTAVGGPQLSSIVAIASGAYHGIALKDDHTVWAWGYNGYGQLGDGTTTSRSMAVQVRASAGLFLTNVVAIAGGVNHTLAIKGDGTVWAWGRNNSGQLGNNATSSGSTPYPVAVSAPVGFPIIAKIAGGQEHSLAVGIDGSVWSWGLNANGQLGDGTTTSPLSTPGPVVGASAMIDVVGGAYHSAALRSDGSVWSWGQNIYNQLGEGTILQSSIPVQTGFLFSEDPAVGSGLQGVTGIAAGLRHGLALVNDGTIDGTVWAWGYNSYGQLGNGTTGGVQSLPGQVVSLPFAIQVGAGQSHSLAIASDGSVWAWGQNVYGQLGDGTNDNGGTPVKVAEAGFQWKVGTPVFNPVPGATPFSTPQSVTITTVTPSAAIRYTTDGNEPTASSTLYVAGTPVQITQTTTLKAKAFVGGKGDSTVTSALYTLKAATPAISPAPGTYPAAQSVSISSTSPGVSIYYTTDGSIPVAGAPSVLYAGPFSVAHTATITAKAFRTGWTDSDPSIATYTMNFGTLSAPTVGPAAGTYEGSASVTMAPAGGSPAGSVVRYTLNGSDPTATSDTYTTAVALTASTTVKAKTFHPDYAPSPTTTQIYTIKLPAPTISPAAGSYAIGQAVTMSTATTGATLRYTVDGLDPTAASSSIASGSAAYLMATMTIRVRAYKTGCDPSDVVTRTYTATGTLPGGGLATGSLQSLVFKPDLSAWVWGENNSGQLGAGFPTDKTVPFSSSVGSVVGLAGGVGHTLFRQNDGTLKATGANSYGQLGTNNTIEQHAPVTVSGFGPTPSANVAIALAAGDHHSLAVKTGGTVWAWGRNQYGQLGDNLTAQRTLANQVTTTIGALNVVAVAAGQYHSLALTSAASGGAVYGWGYNLKGQVGDGTSGSPTNDRRTPVLALAANVSNAVVAIAAGNDFSLALRSDGTVYAWGNNASGQLGTGNTTLSASPIQVLAAVGEVLTGVRAIGVAGNTAYAVRRDGTLWSWGANSSGELGIDSASGSSTLPVQVSSLSKVVRVSAGHGSHVLALDLDGAVWAWGATGSGQVGDGTIADNRLAPVRVSEPGYAWKVATPKMSVNSGLYYTTQSVAITSDTSGAQIYYTTDGSTPIQDPAKLVTGSITVDAGLTLKAKAWATGLSPSNVEAETYTFRFNAPTATSAAGTYNNDHNVVLSYPSVAGVTIRYTLDGTQPEETPPASPPYTSPIPVTKTMTIRARAFKPGWESPTNPPANASFNYTLAVAAPTMVPGGGTYATAQTVTVSTVTTGALVHYTTNGFEPTESSPVLASGGTLSVPVSTTLKVRAWKSGYTPSSTTSANYTIGAVTSAAPTFTPPAGTYSVAQSVSLTTTTPDATIRYTTDGTDPSWTSAVYTSPITVDWTTTLKAKAYKGDYSGSAVASAAYTINVTAVAPPALSPPPGTYTTRQTVTLTTATAGAEIHYTMNGVDPTLADPFVLSGGTVLVSAELPLKAKAFKTGLTASPLRRGDYHITGAVCSGDTHALVLKVDGTVWAWGTNVDGSLGNGTTTASTTPVQVVTAPSQPLTDVVAISCAGDDFRSSSFAVKSNGTVWAWGSNGSKQLGDGTTTARSYATQINPPPSAPMANVIAVAAGSMHTLALTSSGAVWAWGFGSNGQLGNGATTDSAVPLQVTQVTDFTDIGAIGAGYRFSVALKRDGTVFTWGYNVYGYLGDGTTTQRTTPGKVTTLTGISGIAVGNYHTLALKTDGAASGSVWGWGENGNYMLMDGTTTSRLSPVKSLTLTRAIAASAAASLLLRDSTANAGTIWGVGYHFADQLNGAGSGFASSSTTPVPLVSGDFFAVASGGKYQVAIRRNLTLLAWGALNREGDGFSLGDGSAASADPDGDGLTNGQEWSLGTDPFNPDTNGDGIPDGAAIHSGKSATRTDMDGDGVANWVERVNGTDPFNADTDGDTHPDGADYYPLDPTRWQAPTPTPGDITPPVITLTEPTNAVCVNCGPALTTTVTTVSPGTVVQVQVWNGPGNTTDWVGLHATAASDTVQVSWKYLNGLITPPATPLTSATLNFAMPSTPGTYNFRFFQNNTYTKLATSLTVTVQ